MSRLDLEVELDLLTVGEGLPLKGTFHLHTEETGISRYLMPSPVQ
jgi:hypothetical protein